ncbi:MAG: hypothetical protein GY868_07970 [Deltaproteobacteria bacterium]|nr:hypothetical protein [Deltaproteobacteria bacterium]
MLPWKLLDSSPTPDGKNELQLFQRGDEYAIRTGGIELMNSRRHGSEDALAELACAPIARRTAARVLVGGLGMGYTLAAALTALQPDATVDLAELVPKVVAWNRDFLGIFAGKPLNDQRVTVHEMDVSLLIKNNPSTFDAIMLDVDNSPDCLVQQDNDTLYCPTGLAAAQTALRPGGVLAVWSVAGDQAFTRRLKEAGFRVEVKTARERGSDKGARHTIWIATAPAGRQSTKKE